MNIKQIEAFLTIVRDGSFAAAADRLNVTQSTISARITELEQELDLILFDRSKRQVQLTYRGREFVRYAERALGAFSDIKRRFRPDAPISGVVRVGVAELIAVTWLSDLTNLVRATYPGVTLQFEVGLNPDLQAGVRDGTIDIALMCYPSDVAGLEIETLGHVDFAWMGAGHVTFPQHPLRPADLATYGIVFQGADSYTTNVMRTWLGPIDSFQHSICNSMSAIAALTQAGVGVSLLAKDYHAEAVAAGRLQVLDTDPPAPSVGFFAVHLAQQEPHEILTAIKRLSQQASSYRKLEH